MRERNDLPVDDPIFAYFPYTYLLLFLLVHNGITYIHRAPLTPDSEFREGGTSEQ